MDILLVVNYGVVPLHLSSHKAQAQSQPKFLSTPYYGQEAIKSFFDHEYPTYGDPPNNNNAIFIRYDGQRWTGVPKANCVEVPDNNCYDGHNGIDFGMQYETVLSGADGIVTKARLDVGNCLIGDGCGYGFVIEIEHTIDGEKYRTRYGHLTTISVSEGASVLAGWTIGASGSTGASSGPHLHFDVYKYINGSWRVIDPFGWQPGPDADVQIDPWAQYATGAVSWCMWKYGEWANVCDSNQPSLPLPRPKTDMEFVVNDTTNNSNGFSKGF
jgi:murein DD-endopeptidase MepM/ murein hydrolase activator NlpD